MPITWITGNSGAGKSTLARKIVQYDGGILLDGEELRKVWVELTLSKEDRWKHALRIARLAKLLDSQGHNVVIASICAYRDLREEIKTMTNCRFIKLDSGRESSKDYPYEL